MTYSQVINIGRKKLTVKCQGQIIYLPAFCGAVFRLILAIKSTIKTEE